MTEDEQVAKLALRARYIDLCRAQRLAYEAWQNAAAGDTEPLAAYSSATAALTAFENEILAGKTANKG